jgi:heme/copper-type cytochrome/quinol oxidase subunit 2
MNELKSFLFNSLTVSAGLIIYTIFLWLSYMMFFKEQESPAEENKENKNKENKNEKLDNYDVLEDV